MALSSQLPVEGTVARGSAFEDSPVNTGKVPGTTNYVATIPMPVTAQLMERGQQRFNINCSPCHGRLGDGKGITTKFGMAVIADLHDSKTRKVVQQADGEIFNTITYGKNLMGPYGGLMTVEDRWAIIAYLRALQRSRLASLEDVPADVRPTLSRAFGASRWRTTEIIMSSPAIASNPPAPLAIEGIMAQAA